MSVAEVAVISPSPDTQTQGNFSGVVSDSAERLNVGIGSGQVALLQNGRCSGGSIAARMGGVSLIATVPTGCTSFVDFFAEVLEGTTYIIALYGDSTNTRVYVTLDFINWAEISQAAGFDGNTRFPGIATNIACAVWKTPRSVISQNIASKDMLVLSDGNVVRTWSPTDNLGAPASDGTHGVGTLNIHTASGAGPTTIGTNVTPHKLVVGQTIRIFGATGNTAINGIWQVLTTPSSTTFTIAAISNGSYTADTAGIAIAMIWNHATPTTPTDANQLHQTCGYNTFIQIAGATRTFPSAAAGSGVNQGTPGTSGYSLSDTTSILPYSVGCPYSGTNKCINWYFNTSPVAGNTSVGSIAAFNPSAAFTFGPQMAMVVENASATAAADAIANTKIIFSTVTPANNFIRISGCATSSGLTRITCTSTTNLTTGDQILIVEVQGVTSVVNGTWVITKIDATHFDLQGSTAVAGVYTAASGTIVIGTAAGSVPGTTYPAYDPTSTDTSLNHLAADIAWDANAQRQQWVFNLGHLQTFQKSAVTSIIFVRLNGAPAVTGSLVILNIASGGKWEGDTIFGGAYEQQYPYTESKGFAAKTADAMLSSSFGGPTLVFVTSTSTVSSPVIPPPALNATIFYDFNFINKNPFPGTPSTVLSAGDLTNYYAGYPDSMSIYVKQSGSTVYQYLCSLNYISPVWSGGGPTATWIYVYAGQNVTFQSNVSFPTLDKTLLDPVRALPTSYQQCIPPAFAYWSGIRRIFAIRPKIGGTILPSEYWFSAQDYHTRWQSSPTSRVPGVLDDTLGASAQLAGQQVNAIIGNAAEAGISGVYMLTGSVFYRAGAPTTTGGSLQASDLASPNPISRHGTNAPQSVRETQGMIQWVDHYGDVVRYTPSYTAQFQFGGGVENLSLRKVGDRIANLPVGRLPFLISASLGKRVFYGYTPSGGTQNTNALVWNSVRQFWESDDLLPSTWDFAKMRRLYDPLHPGSGERLFCMTHDGKLFAYDESSTEFGGPTVDMMIRTGVMWIPGKSFYMRDMSFFGQFQAGKRMDVRYFYVDTNLEGSCSMSLFDSDDPLLPFIANKSDIQPVDVGLGDGQGSAMVYSEYEWPYAPGSIMNRLVQEIETQTGTAAKR